ncbi:MAG TPA: ATP phosphoribosyltransferase regulatory subunit [Thermoleophilia bacterium]|nr:ATP phosphoribosyltransferase regulatory subunit [Thermoleophilia bacterium]
MIPEGMHDVLPDEAAELHAIDVALRARFSAYGYGEVRTPALEFAETLELPDDDTLSAGYRLFDDRGRELMLRTDMTVPVVRLAAARYRDKPLPLRFFYVGASYRPWAPQRSQDGEFLQAGVELLGAPSAEADAECVTLLCDALEACGLPDYHVTLNTMAFPTALVDTLGLVEDGDRESLLEALADRDYPLLESIAANAAVADEALKALQAALTLGGTRDSLAQARKLATTPAMVAAIDRLVKVRDLVADAGYERAVTFDFGLYQDLSYYTGVIFEAWAPGVGLPIASGGRYDGLAAHFDWEVPGVGFAIAVERLRDALDEAGRLPAVASPALAFAGGLDEPERVAELRRAGIAVAALPGDALPPAPLLRRVGGRYVLELSDGARTEGPWRDIRRALGIA